ncbi:MAG: DUF3592 domain-containing protein [Kiritimatiellae bacterium]|nr:DUF3592 domain-containing protein [Kiritimatiellia bacterium]
MPLPSHTRRDAIHYGTLFSGCLWLAVVFTFLWFFTSPLRSRGSSTATWPEVPCRIESSSVERRAVDDFAFTAEYAFYWNGRMRHATALNRTNDTHYAFSSLADRLPLLEKYAPGTEHLCRVDPANDDTAYLRVKRPGDDASSSGSWGFWLALGTFFLLVVLAGVWQIAGAFPKVRRFWDGRLKTAVPALFLLLFGVPFAVAGAGMLISEALPSLKLAREDLVSVPGKVLYTGISSHSGDRSTTYSAVVAYEYDFQGKKYENDRLDGLSGDFSTSDRRSIRQLAHSYQPGSAVEVWVLPSDPRRSAIRPVGSTVKYGTLGASLLFLLVGLGVSGTGVFLLLRALRAKPAAQPGQWTLRRSCANTISLGAFALFWNLLSWSITLVFMGEPGPRDPMILLVWMFPLIGLGLAAAFAVSLRRDLHAPKLAMTLSLPDGTTPTLDWRLDDPSAIRSLSIQLEGTTAGSKHSGPDVVISIPVCKHPSPVPETWRETFHFPPDPSDAQKWRLAATLRTAASPRRPILLHYPLPPSSLPF